MHAAPLIFPYTPTLQGQYLLVGNHHYSDPYYRLVLPVFGLPENGIVWSIRLCLLSPAQHFLCSTRLFVACINSASVFLAE